MGETRNAYMLVGESEGKTPFGRQNRWKDNIRMGLRKIG
jgi:hypothetical protein